MPRLARTLIIVVLIVSLAANAFMYLRWRRTRPILTINGQTISEKDVIDYLEMQAGPTVKAALVQRALLDQEARKQGVVPSQAEIDKQYDQRKELDPRIAQQVASNPWYEMFMKNQIREDLEQERLRAKAIPVTDDEIKEEYNAHPDAYDIPNKAHCNLAAVMSTASDDDVTQIRQLLEKGVSPADIQANFAGSVIFLGDNSIFTFVQPFGTNANSEIFTMKPQQVKELPATQRGVRALFVRLVDIAPGHKYNPSDPKDADITERIRLAVAGKRMKTLPEWLEEEWEHGNVQLTTEDPNDKRWIELQLVPALARRNLKQ